jgi:hypothetical protein
MRMEAIEWACAFHRRYLGGVGIVLGKVGIELGLLHHLRLRLGAPLPLASDFPSPARGSFASPNMTAAVVHQLETMKNDLKIANEPGGGLRVKLAEATTMTDAESFQEQQVRIDRYRVLEREVTDPLAARLLHDIVLELEAAAARRPTPHQRLPSGSNET